MYRSNKEIQINEYDSLGMKLTLLEDDGSPRSLNGLNISSTLRTINGEFVDQFEVIVVNSLEGEFILKKTIVKFPLRDLFLDIKFEQGGSVVHSDVLQLSVLKSVTE